MPRRPRRHHGKKEKEKKKKNKKKKRGWGLLGLCTLVILMSCLLWFYASLVAETVRVLKSSQEFKRTLRTVTNDEQEINANADVAGNASAFAKSSTPMQGGFAKAPSWQHKVKPRIRGNRARGQKVSSLDSAHEQQALQPVPCPKSRNAASYSSTATFHERYRLVREWLRFPGMITVNDKSKTSRLDPMTIASVNEYLRLSAEDGHKCPSILMFTSALSRDITGAAKGGSMGEVRYMGSIMEIIMALCSSQGMVFAGSTDDIHALLRSGVSMENFSVIVTDTSSLDTLLALSQPIQCKLRILDVWGTPHEQNHHKLKSKQFWVPFPFAAPHHAIDDSLNTVIANIISGPGSQDDIPPSICELQHMLHAAMRGDNHSLRVVQKIDKIMRGKKRQGVIWGKEPKYFTPQVMDQLSSIVSELGLTLYVTGTDEVSCLLPDGIVNVGILSDKQRQELFLHSIFFLGLGDPVLGASPFEAVSHGCVYLNPVFPKGPRQLWQNTNFLCGSQHPYASYIGAPLVHNVMFQTPHRGKDSMSVIDVVRSVTNDWSKYWGKGHQVMMGKKQTTTRAWNRNVQAAFPFVPKNMRKAYIKHALFSSLKKDFCSLSPDSIKAPSDNPWEMLLKEKSGRCASSINKYGSRVRTTHNTHLDTSSGEKKEENNEWAGVLGIPSLHSLGTNNLDASNSCQKYRARTGMDIIGQDVLSVPFEELSSENLETCCAACSKHAPLCKSFTAKQGKCYLKSARQATAMRRSHDSKVVSAWRYDS